jgi:hypothetical protein
VPLTPGIDCVLVMVGARLAADLDLECEMPERGEVVRGRYGIDDGPHPGELGDEGLGSVERRRVGGFLVTSISKVEGADGLWSRSDGKGEGLNSSILSVSGTGSMINRCPGGEPGSSSYLGRHEAITTTMHRVRSYVPCSKKTVGQGE